MASGTLALQHPSDEDVILDLAQHGSDKDGSDSDGSDEEFDDSKNDFSTDGCSDHPPTKQSILCVSRAPVTALRKAQLKFLFARNRLTKEVIIDDDTDGSLNCILQLDLSNESEVGALSCA